MFQVCPPDALADLRTAVPVVEHEPVVGDHHPRQGLLVDHRLAEVYVYLLVGELERLKGRLEPLTGAKLI